MIAKGDSALPIRADELCRIGDEERPLVRILPVKLGIYYDLKAF